jgi:hypothetical protein
MNRSNETRLRKLESETAGDAGLALIAFGPGETAEEATARFFQRRPHDRAKLRTICINTGVQSSGEGFCGGEGVLQGAEGFCFFDSHQLPAAKSLSCVAKHEDGSNKSISRGHGVHDSPFNAPGLAIASCARPAAN